MLSLVGIIVGLALLIFLAFRGKSLLWAAPVCALLVAFTGGLDMFTAYTQNYMEGMVGFVKEWFPAFMLGAIFGQIMQDSGGERDAVLLQAVNPAWRKNLCQNYELEMFSSSIPSIARAISASASICSSASLTNFSWGLVRGCFGVKTVQQSS